MSVPHQQARKAVIAQSQPALTYSQSVIFMIFLNHSDMINVIQIKVFIVITDKPMSTQLSKMPSKAAL